MCKETFVTTDVAPVNCCSALDAPALSDTQAVAIAALYRALGHAARVHIVNLLLINPKPICVCQLLEPLGLSQGTVSHHLKKLVEAGLVEREQRGRWAYFSLKREALARLASLADLTQEGCCS
jgi:ArsR family transcriptional regulator